MEFEWDEEKRQENLHKHVLDFEDAERWLGNRGVNDADRRRDYGELRLKFLVWTHAGALSIAYALRNGTVRLISARKASRRERARLRRWRIP